ncbi:Ger(x)C family spore germination protein [Paenibacillus filicis]|uniref:Ger(X)C family spore germination protein n=1 Tax=Paenibacillus gyeongsangnamensis TaxID=3388067 RepID=A0ABT4Q7A4_9BACL|nr:Ger(x)C family spore germination protein [Paenibacillus filicis]MCZ8512714.1 Ger(x)C family spore germination protein [Paenibacillus filicis]
MRRLRLAFLILIVVSLLTGCWDRLDLEHSTLTLMMGFDLDDKDNLIVYAASPVFSKTAKKKVENFGVKVKSIRQARTRLDSMVTGMATAGKLQVVLLSKRLLQHEDWFPLFDIMFRDVHFNATARVVAVDGPVAEIFDFAPKDKPLLPYHMAELIDTSNKRNITVKRTLQDLHRQMDDKGVTASITEIKKVKEIEVKGTSALTKKGKYKTLLRLQESALLLLLQREERKSVSLTIPAPKQADTGDVIEPRLSFSMRHTAPKFKVSYQNGRFDIDIKLKLNVLITERTFLMDIQENNKMLEEHIANEVTKEIEKLVKRLQKNKVDPVGFGYYARGYQYQEWKKVEQNWEEAFSKANVRVSTKVTIKGKGTWG